MLVDLQMKNNFNRDRFCEEKKQKYKHGGRLSIKIHILFCGDISRCKVGIPISFMSIVILFKDAFKYGDDVKVCGYVGTNTESLFRIM
jgi:hypothetical protein